MVDKTKHLISPAPASLIVTARYKIPMTNWAEMIREILIALPDWRLVTQQRQAAKFVYFPLYSWERENLEKLKSKDSRKAGKKELELLEQKLKEVRKGMPADFRVLLEQHLPDGVIIKAKCAPAMYLLITKGIEREFHEQSVQEARIECVDFVEELMKGVLGGQEITPPTVEPLNFLNLALLLEKARPLEIDENWVSAICALNLLEISVNKKLEDLGESTDGSFDTRYKRLVVACKAKENRDIQKLLTAPFYTARSKMDHAGHIHKPTPDETKIIVKYVSDFMSELFCKET